MYGRMSLHECSLEHSTGPFGYQNTHKGIPMLIDVTTTAPDYFGQRTALEKRYPSTRSMSSSAKVSQKDNSGLIMRYGAIMMIVATFAYIGVSTLNMGVAIVG